MECQNKFAYGNYRCPDPYAFGILFHVGHQFIQLKMTNGQRPVKQPLMQMFTMLATALDPVGDGGGVMTKDAACG